MEFRMIRTGKISSINYKNASARVEFDDAPGIISKELKVLIPHTKNEKNYSMPGPKEDVVCVFLPHAPSTGFIIGSYSSGKNLPSESGKIKYIFFPDGTRIKYNMESSLLEIDCAGDIEITSGNVVSLSATEIVLSSETKVSIEAGTEVILNGTKVSLGGGTGTLEVSNSGANCNSEITCEDVTTSKGSYNAHIDSFHS